MVKYPIADKLKTFVRRYHDISPVKQVQNPIKSNIKKQMFIAIIYYLMI